MLLYIILYCNISVLFYLLNNIFILFYFHVFFSSKLDVGDGITCVAISTYLKIFFKLNLIFVLIYSEIIS